MKKQKRILPVVKCEILVLLSDGNYENRLVNCEVLTVHFNTGRMRVRYSDGEHVRTKDISNAVFLEDYFVLPKEVGLAARDVL